MEEKHNLWAMIVIALIQFIFKLMVTVFLLIIAFPLFIALILIYAAIAAIKLWFGIIFDFWRTGMVKFDETD